MAREIINVGAAEDDGTGEPLRNAWIKVNNMTSEIYTTFGDGSTLSSAGGVVPVEDDGSEIVAAPSALNFTGAGVTVTDVSGVATIDIPGGGGSGTVDVVSNVATNTILGRTTAGSGDSEELTPAQARDLLNVDETGIVPITTLGVLDTVDLALTDAGRIFEVDEASSSYTIIRVPDDATLNLPIGFTFTVVKLTDSTVSYNPEVAALNASVS